MILVVSDSYPTEASAGFSAKAVGMDPEKHVSIEYIASFGWHMRVTRKVSFCNL